MAGGGDYRHQRPFDAAVAGALRAAWGYLKKGKFMYVKASVYTDRLRCHNRHGLLCGQGRVYVVNLRNEAPGSNDRDTSASFFRFA